MIQPRADAEATDNKKDKTTRNFLRAFQINFSQNWLGATRKVAQRGVHLKMEPGEAITLIVHRDNIDPSKYLVVVRKANGAFHPQSHDFELEGGQEAVLELGHIRDLPIAIEQGISAMRGIQA